MVDYGVISDYIDLYIYICLGNSHFDSILRTSKSSKVSSQSTYSSLLIIYL